MKSCAAKLKGHNCGILWEGRGLNAYAQSPSILHTEQEEPMDVEETKNNEQKSPEKSILRHQRDWYSSCCSCRIYCGRSTDLRTGT